MCSIIGSMKAFSALFELATFLEWTHIFYQHTEGKALRVQLQLYTMNTNNIPDNQMMQPHNNSKISSHQLATCFGISSTFPFTFRSTISPPINLSSILLPSFSIDMTATCCPFSTYVRDFFLIFPDGLEV